MTRIVLHQSPPFRKKTRPRVLLKTKDNLEDEACNEGVIDLAI